MLHSESSSLQARIPNKLTWAIVRIVIETLNLVVCQCLLNQGKGY
jgi:hypothetical protein